MNVPAGIVDGGTMTNSLFVPASGGKIVDLDIALSIQHTWNDDLDITLTHVATGTSVVLWTDCGSSDDGFIVMLSDEAGGDICAATAPTAGAAITGTYHPEGLAALSVFDTEDASGLWRLTISDDTFPDTGTLFGWSLHITY